MGNKSKAPEHIWAWWDNDYDVGMINTHGDKRYTPTEAREYVPADMIEDLEAKLEKAVRSLEKLARLGNGGLYGNSDGNMIARIALAELEGEK